MPQRFLLTLVALIPLACDAEPTAADEFVAAADRSLDGLDACMAGCSIDHEQCVIDAIQGCDIYAEQSPLPLVEDSCVFQLSECRGARNGCEADCFDIFGVSGGDDGGGDDGGGDDGGGDDGGSATAGPPNPCSSCPAGQSCHCEPFVCVPNGVACQ